MPDLGESFADTHIKYQISLWNTEQVEQQANISTAMNVDQTAAAAAFWLWPCHLHCPLQEGEGHCLSGVSSRVRRLPSCKSPPVVGSSCPVTRIRLTFFLFFCFRAYLRGQRWGRASLLDPDVFLFCFLWVSICASTEGLTLYRGFTKNSTAWGRLTGDQWSYCVFVCLETLILFLSGKTNRTGWRLSCAPEATTWGGLFIAFSGTSFLSSLFIFYFFCLKM